MLFRSATGISLTIQNWIPLRLSLISGAVNVLLFLLGWAVMGWKFAATSLVSTMIYPVIMAIFEEMDPGRLFGGDKLICAVFASVLIGVGIGLVVRAGGSTGGMDIPPCILQKYKGIPVGTSMMVFDSLILLMQVCYRGLDGILYSVLITALSSAMVNKTIVSGERKIEIIIISPAYEEIRQRVLKSMDNGVTLLEIETGYRGEKQKAVFSIAHSKKYPEIKAAALEVDPKAFIVAAEVMDVSGRGYTLARTGEIG